MPIFYSSTHRHAMCAGPRFSGKIIGLEYVAEWTISCLIRVPFYHVFKTTFLLYLSLPQTRGASYVYSVHLHPRTDKHEVEIDAALGRIKE
ncbi:hypothetical protein JB92DRAFT_3023884 [Gautieria morchelliformis]|nr:hypothetical protein JB92DRAFT_3023884 [Gautieria morchelliformis]